MGCGPAAEAETRRLQQSKARAEVVARSEPLELLCISPVSFKLQARKAHTVLEVLEMVAQQMQLPGKAGALLKMQFAEAIIAHHNSMHEAGLCDQAEFSVLGEDEARAQLKKEAEAEAVDIHDASRQGDMDAVRLVVEFAPEKVNAKNGVTARSARLMLLIVLIPVHPAGTIDSLLRMLTDLGG